MDRASAPVEKNISETSQSRLIPPALRFEYWQLYELVRMTLLKRDSTACTRQMYVQDARVKSHQEVTGLRGSGEVGSDLFTKKATNEKTICPYFRLQDISHRRVGHI